MPQPPTIGDVKADVVLRALVLSDGAYGLNERAHTARQIRLMDHRNHLAVNGAGVWVDAHSDLCRPHLVSGNQYPVAGRRAPELHIQPRIGGDWRAPGHVTRRPDDNRVVAATDALIDLEAHTDRPCARVDHHSGRGQWPRLVAHTARDGEADRLVDSAIGEALRHACEEQGGIVYGLSRKPPAQGRGRALEAVE